jgi:glycosyltransferase involved in cell wall biosynthesis
MADKKTVDVIIPVYNEEKALAKSVRTLHGFLSKNFSDYDWKIIIADNASKDSTLDVAKDLSAKMKKVGYIHLDQKGRGRALRKAWTESNADIVSYMDVDLSTDINAFPKMIEGMLAKGYNVATGTRLTKKSRTKRRFYREFLSRGYNYIVRTILWIKYSDAQCGFKAATRKAVRDIVPLIQDNEWFFDTELMTLAEKYDYGIYEIPVTWIEDTDSRVRIAKTVYQYLRDVTRLRFQLWFRKDLRKLKSMNKG